MTFAFPPFLHSAVALTVAFVLGGAIGIERQLRQRMAGLRTNVLVAVGAAAFVDLGMRMAGPSGGVHVVGYVVSGIGFLGAGVIMKEGAQVRGLNTAATLWASAAVGAFAGGGQTGEAVLVAAFVLAGNTLLRPIVDIINRRPVTAAETEAHYRVHIVCDPEKVASARDLLFEELERHDYPIREIETLSESDEVVELAASLVPTSADADELNLIVTHLQRSPDVVSATWTVSTDD
jgi:putative Mg2+ transporter-C (MgtC) family protein